jgi:lipopolysaccharide biosynthesis glycosyltransferase
VTWALDAGFARCTLVSLFSLLRNATCPVRAVFLCAGDLGDFRDRVRRIAGAFRGTDAVFLDPGIASTDDRKHISAATLLRLRLPEVIEGRVLYLDGDTLVRADVAPLFFTDLDGQPVGAAPDPAAVRSEAAMQWRNLPWWRPGHMRFMWHLQSLGMRRPGAYFNAGVMVMDCARIRALGLDTAMADADAAGRYHLRDQDHLNVVFRDRVTLIDPAWNAIWGNQRTGGRPLPPLDVDRFAASRRDPRILHFTGAGKPWTAPPETLRVPKWAREWVDAEATLTALETR